MLLKGFRMLLICQMIEKCSTFSHPRCIESIITRSCSMIMRLGVLLCPGVDGLLLSFGIGSSGHNRTRGPLELVKHGSPGEGCISLIWRFSWAVRSIAFDPTKSSGIA